MNELTRYRGPDETGYFVDDNISLGHNRLSIIDLSERGKQPMWDVKKETAVIFNGEIYNFQELRKELEKKYYFQSKTDTEVILYAYREYGEDCLKKLNGIFSFAIWDTHSQELFIARDPMGIKPLYYYFDGNKFIFSSEIKAILAHDIPREVDPTAFNLFFHVLYVPEPYTMFKNIKKLAPGHFLKLKNNQIEIKKYWQVENFSDLNSYSEAVKEINTVFLDSIEKQLVSDRPVGVFLSGGMDSTAVLGAVKENKSGAVKTFSVGFDIADEKYNADFLLAQKTSKHYGTDHRELKISANDILENLEDIVWHLDEPNFNPTAGAVYLLSKKAKQEVAVVLGGDGGDELFGGYPRYHYSRILSYYKKSPAVVRSLFQKILKLSGRNNLAERIETEGAEKILTFLSLKNDLVSKVLRNCDSGAVSDYFDKKYFKENDNLSEDFEKQFMNMDRQSWLVDESLLRTDKMSMAWGLEERVPILDYRLVELSARIPTNWKLNVWQNPKNFQGKRIWKDAVKRYLPDHILSAKKRGWFTPMAKWLRGDLRPFAEEMLSVDRLNSEFFKVEEVQKIWYDHLNGKQYNLNLIWAIIMWQMWYERFIKNKI